MQYRVLIEQDEDGVYIAEVPALPGCISQGQTRIEVIENIREAIAAYLESLAAHNEPTPHQRNIARDPARNWVDG
jgi:predicted RNase H-like HicB family nuclease